MATNAPNEADYLFKDTNIQFAIGYGGWSSAEVLIAKSAPGQHVLIITSPSGVLFKGYMDMNWRIVCDEVTDADACIIHWTHPAMNNTLAHLRYQWSRLDVCKILYDQIFASRRAAAEFQAESEDRVNQILEMERNRISGVPAQAAGGAAAVQGR